MSLGRQNNRREKKINPSIKTSKSNQPQHNNMDGELGRVRCLAKDHLFGLFCSVHVSSLMRKEANGGVKDRNDE